MEMESLKLRLLLIRLEEGVVATTLLADIEGVVLDWGLRVARILPIAIGNATADKGENDDNRDDDADNRGHRERSGQNHRLLINGGSNGAGLGQGVARIGLVVAEVDVAG